MTSRAKIAANRRNALKSTGPRTRSGKVRSSRNALTHGLTANHFIVKGEGQAEFQRLAEDVLAQFPPRNVIERHQVDRLIELLWKTHRARLYETATLDKCHSTDDTGLPLPTKFRLEYPISDYFAIAERIDGYVNRTWREIYQLVDDLSANRILQPELILIDGQSEEIADPQPEGLKEAS